MAEQSPEVSLPTDSEQSEWVADAKEKLSGFFDLRGLTEQFHQLKRYLKKARCGAIVAEAIFHDLNKDIDKLFYDTCDVANQSHDLMKLFESKCKQALSDARNIRVHLQDGNIKMAVRKFKRLQKISLMMETRSAKMLDKFDSLSKRVREVADRTLEKKSGGARGKSDLCDRLEQIDSLLKNHRVKLREAMEEMHHAQREKDICETKLDAASKPSYVKSVLKHLKSVSVDIISFVSLKPEFRVPDLTLEKEMFNTKAAAHAKAKVEKERCVDKVSHLGIRKRKVEQQISKLGTVSECLQGSIVFMNSLSVSMFKITSFWRHIKECCSSVSEATADELENVEIELETDGSEQSQRSDYLEYDGVRLSLDHFTDLWVVLREVCTMSKEELREVTEDLFSTYKNNLSLAEAESYLQATLQTINP